ncbi:hypothetical protein C3Y05_015905 [Aeromonas allosaccharophila]|uniref:hypothetical protein n=1 Tax=Aeromonas allosaccharophila TaxID=656 RepID=UPI0013CA270E|nr:hypothetical protein [Aeromonas allosaccharophila]WDO01129.1 hypothetical protein C3Y05_015905 [Aeromonas allosaccharophila]
MVQATEPGGMEMSPGREWDKQSIYLRQQDGIPMVFWVKGEQVFPLDPSPSGAEYQGHFGWGQAGEATMALAEVIVAKLVAEGLISPDLAASRAGYLYNEVLVKLPAGEHYDLHLSYLRLLFGEDGVTRP